MKRITNKVSKPDLIGIGAPKCRTTWRETALAEHPQICFAVIKKMEFIPRKQITG